MLTEPKIAERPAQPYVAIRRVVGMPFGDVVDATLPRLWRWIEGHGLEPVGAPFFKYNLIDMPNRLEIEFGAPLAEMPRADDEVVTGVLPAGRYATLTYHGPYDGLMGANAALIDWAAANGHAFDAESTPEGERFACRYESYTSDPREVPDPADWETVLFYKLVGGTAGVAFALRQSRRSEMLEDKEPIATVAVRDLATAKPFYRDLLGLHLADENSEVLTFTAGSFRLFVYRSQFAGTNQATAVTWAVGAGEVEPIVRELGRRGIRFEHYDMPNGRRDGDLHVFDGFKVAWFKDPDGNILSVNGM